MSERDNPRRRSYPPVVEIQEGLETTLANVQDNETSRIPHPMGGEVEVDTRSLMRERIVGQHAVDLLAQKGELLGIVTRTNPETGEKTPIKVVDLSNDDFGTEVFLDPTDGRRPEYVLSEDPFREGTNPYARGGSRMGLPKGEGALDELFNMREEAKLNEDVPRAAAAPEVLPADDPGARYRARREKTARARREVDEEPEDNTYRTWMIGPQ